MKGFKKLTSIILCAVLTFTALPIATFATDNDGYHCEIKFKNECPKNLTLGESTEIYIDYYVGENKDINIVWSVSGTMCEYEYITDSESGLGTGMKITCVSGGIFYAFVSILDLDGNELAKDNIEIWCEVPDNKPLNEKIDEFIDMLPANSGLLGYCLAYIAAIVSVGPVTGMIETCIVIHIKLSELINRLYELFLEAK